jgi:hypothetical protein
MAAAFSEQVRKELDGEVRQIIADALRSLEQGQSLQYAQARLREIGKRLQSLEIEFRGGCTW